MPLLHLKLIQGMIFHEGFWNQWTRCSWNQFSVAILRAMTESTVLCILCTYISALVPLSPWSMASFHPLQFCHITCKRAQFQSCKALPKTTVTEVMYLVEYLEAYTQQYALFKMYFFFPENPHQIVPLL